MFDLTDISNDMMSLRNFILRKSMSLSLQHDVRVFFSVEAYGRTLIYSSEPDYKCHLLRIYNSKRKMKIYNNKDYKRLLSSEGRNKNKNFDEKNEEFYQIEEEPENCESRSVNNIPAMSEVKMRKKSIKNLVGKINEIIPDSYVEPNIRAAIERKFPNSNSNKKYKNNEGKKYKSKDQETKIQKLFKLSNEDNKCVSTLSSQIEETQEHSINENNTLAKDILFKNEKPYFSFGEKTKNFNLLNLSNNSNHLSFSISDSKNILQENNYDNYDNYEIISHNSKNSEKLFNISLSKINNYQELENKNLNDITQNTSRKESFEKFYNFNESYIPKESLEKFSFQENDISAFYLKDINTNMENLSSSSDFLIKKTNRQIDLDSSILYIFPYYANYRPSHMLQDMLKHFKILNYGNYPLREKSEMYTFKSPGNALSSLNLNSAFQPLDNNFKKSSQS
jgi:hypothetical protein